MEELENRLSGDRVSAAPKAAPESLGGSRRPGRQRQLRALRAAPQRTDPVLRFWLRRLGRFDASPLYRIRRAI